MVANERHIPTCDLLNLWNIYGKYRASRGEGGTRRNKNGKDRPENPQDWFLGKRSSREQQVGGIRRLWWGHGPAGSSRGILLIGWPVERMTKKKGIKEGEKKKWGEVRTVANWKVMHLWIGVEIAAWEGQ